MTAKSDHGNPTRICYLVVKGSSNWVIGRNVTRASDVLHYGCSIILFPPLNGVRDSICMLEDGLHCLIDIVRLSSSCTESDSEHLAGSRATIHSLDTYIIHYWSKLRGIVDKVHRHTFGHFSYADMRILIHRNQLWTEDIQNFLSYII